MSDTVRFPELIKATSRETSSTANTLQDGLHFQDPANFTQGYIEKFDYANGVMWVNGMRVQINDPAITFTVPNPDGTPLLDGSGNPIVLTKGRYSAESRLIPVLPLTRTTLP